MKYYLITSSFHKYDEFKSIFQKYNIPITRADFVGRDGRGSGTYIREAVKMVDYYTNEPVHNYEDCRRVRVVSHMSVMDDGTQSSFYTNSVEGFIDLSKKQDESIDVFGWDDIFVVKNTNMTYYEMRELGFKVSPRDNNVSEFLREYVYYSSRKCFKFTRLDVQDRTIDFESRGCYQFIKENSEFLQRNDNLFNLFTKVCNEGAFLRSVQNRRENNYWCPGLNAGIPHVQKRDKIHELTFTVHDFFHFLVPDLVFTGKSDRLSKNVYVITRMLSEAITIVLADMVFVDTLTDTYEYDWTKRKIWPLYNSIDKGTKVTDIISANALYCLLGDSSGYTKLGVDDTAFQQFHDKYTPFFVEDYRWTNNNWKSMVCDSGHFESWWENVRVARDHYQIDRDFGRLETIDEYIERNRLDDGMEIEDLVSTILHDLLGNFDLDNQGPRKVPFNSELAIANNAFARWITGQLLIFNKFYFIPDSKFYQEKIVNFIVDREDLLSFQDIRNVRGLYEQYLDILLEKSLISKDDRVTFAEIYPIFKPSFVDYDKGIDEYKSISDVWKTIYE